MAALWTIAANPRKRARRKGRSAAQKAATRRMLAANRARKNPRRAVKRRRAMRSSVASAAPARRVTRRSARRSVRRSSARRVTAGFRSVTGGAMGLLKAGAVGAGGAIAVDVAQGFVNGFLPATMATKLNADGSVNYINAAVKFGVTLGVRALALKVVSADTANKMALGAVTMQVYELVRPLVQGILPASMSMGWYSPGMTFRPPGALNRMGQYPSLSKMGQYQGTRTVTPFRSPNAVAANSRR